MHGNTKYGLTIPTDTQSEEFAYWCGFLLADGCISKQGSRSYKITISLNPHDVEHLEKWKDFLQSNHRIYVYPKSVQVSINSNELAELFMQYGVTPRKSKTASVPDIFSNNRHFWRGVMDGDGYIGKQSDRFSICGTKDVCDAFSKFMSLDLEAKERAPGFYVLETCGKNKTRMVLNTLYNNANVALDRKAALARRV